MSPKKVEEIVFSNPVVVFRHSLFFPSKCLILCGKTYCGYSKRDKQILTELEAVYKIIELDEERDGHEIQRALAEWTGQGTVPNVFVAGKHIGGSDSVVAKYQAGELLNLLVAAGAIPNMQLQIAVET